VLPVPRPASRWPDLGADAGTSCRSFRDSLRSSRGDSSGHNRWRHWRRRHAGRLGARPPAHRTSARCKMDRRQQMLGEMGSWPSAEQAEEERSRDPELKPRIGSSSRLITSCLRGPCHLTYITVRGAGDGAAVPDSAHRTGRNPGRRTECRARSGMQAAAAGSQSAGASPVASNAARPLCRIS